MRRRRLRIGRVLDCFSSSLQCAGGCVCVRALDDEEDAAVEREALVASGRRRQQLQDQVLRLRDLVDGTRTLGFHLQPKTVELRVSMHCNGCAKKVHKHISKMEVALVASQTELSSRFMPKLCYSRHLSGGTWFEVDLESKKVVVKGDVTPFEVLQSVSKVKFAQLWMAGPQRT
ncbi:uncharacterized protein LOC120698018 isoform X2 [Panicum virgatum]|uniref:HMA domain-containing protein n=1 Tax=Panicum virgatum TaxID=38727 RepID=A0A8T0UV99_PANVG|nr:uncharacterized protein LOC120698018 isoform X2 [Panicum virgatum]KAG2626177.1 hypothetical protein PVAP13_3KG326000 [Panicum virgatum]